MTEQQQLFWQVASGMAARVGLNAEDPRLLQAVQGEPDPHNWMLKWSTKIAQLKAPAAQPAASRAVAPRTASPPVEGAPSGGSGLNTADDVMSAYATDKIDRDTYIKRMAALGQPVTR